MDIICKYENEEWRATVSNLRATDGCARFNVKARGSSIEVVAGKTDEIYWVIFPNLGNGCVLANPYDIHWNSEAITNTLNSIPDGISVATALYHAINKLEGIDTGSEITDEDRCYFIGGKLLVGQEAVDFVNQENDYWLNKHDIIHDQVATIMQVFNKCIISTEDDFELKTRNIETIKRELETVQLLAELLKSKLNDALYR